MVLSEEAKKVFAQHKEHYPASEIRQNDEFNCRGELKEHEIKPLAKDIAAHGLFTPITIRELPGEDGKKYEIVAGHRRFKAMQMIGVKEVPASLLKLTEEQAHSINLRENIKRQDLNYWQEARALIYYKDRNRDPFWLGQELGQTENWVNDRYKLIEMDPEIQSFAADGLIKPADVRALYPYKPEEQLKYASLLADARLKGNDSAKLQDFLPKSDKKKNTYRQRSKSEMREMMEFIQNECKPLGAETTIITKGGNSLATKALAWAAGDINDEALDNALVDFTTGIRELIDE